MMRRAHAFLDDDQCWQRGPKIAPVPRDAAGACEVLFVGFSDDRRFVLPFVLVFAFEIIVLIVFGVSRRHRVAHDGDDAAVNPPGAYDLGPARGHVGSC